MASLELYKTNMLNNLDDIKQTCSPLYQTGLVNYFIYSKIYEDGTRIYVCDRPDWFINYHQDLYDLGASNKLYRCEIKDYVPWSNFIDQQIFHIAYQQFNLAPPLLKIQQLHNTREILIFGPGRSINALDLYAHQDLLQGFLFYFKDKAKKTLQKIEADRYLLPKAQVTTNLLQNSSLPKQTLDFKDEVERYYINPNYPKQYLTGKEVNCIRLLALGKTAKQTARLLEISARTVEAHLEKAKSKLEAANRYELVFKATKLDII